MKTSWNKGHTKRTHPSLQKTSDTMKRKGLDNFKAWRDEMKRKGKIKSSYPSLKKDGDLAELIGVVLGDGNIHVFERTESLRIVGNAKNAGFVSHYAVLVEKIFKKKPRVSKRKFSNATDIVIYEKKISARLGIPSGARGALTIATPSWVKRKKEFKIRYLRGLYEAEGSLCFHEKTYTHKFLFSNRNQSILKNVFTLVKELGFHPHISPSQVQVSRKEEVQKLKNLLRFRSYA